MEDEFNKTCCYIDGSSFQDGKVKLKKVLQKDCKGLPAKHLQYRLKPAAEEYKPQVSQVFLVVNALQVNTIIHTNVAFLNQVALKGPSFRIK